MYVLICGFYCRLHTKGKCAVSFIISLKGIKDAYKTETTTANTSDKLEDGYEIDLTNTAETSLTERPTDLGLQNTSVNPDTLLMTYRFCHCYKYTTNARVLGEQKNDTSLAWLILSHRTA